ncbi:LysR family transcriptional regulator [Ramlibacter sp. G-1-2-2]|uniref:LysR family transcriptional regulator n=1 Tax=Ramlibacter agri TaxID=2728837 RepID=A0A848HC26_9BURK|nr:LysR substrate-binding domain-containing protein [Ramlibacter agri]NML47020.1 LysR family transcriptional regulator [Ramlibacter agri]
MKLSSLQALVAAVQEGSLRAAARRLDISQPALTKAVRELEREIGAPLLLRSRAGVVASTQGRALYEAALRVDRELAGAAEQIEQLGGHMVGEIKVGAVPQALILLIPETLRTFCSEFPEIRLRVTEELYVAQLAKLRDGAVDLLVGPLPTGLAAGEFVTEALLPLQMAVVARQGSKLARASSLKELAAARAKWVYTSQSGGAGYVQDLFRHHGLEPPPALAVGNSTLALWSMITGGDYVGLMPLAIAGHPLGAHGMSIVPIQEGHLKLTVGVMARKDTLLKPVIRHFMAHLQRAAHHALGDMGAAAA